MRMGWLMLAVALSLTACASHCPEVNTLREALATRPATSEPHLVLSIPFAVAQPLVDAELATMSALRIPLLDIEARAQRAQLIASDGDLALDTQLTIRRDEEELAALGATIVLAPTIEGGNITFAIRPADLKSVEPRITPLGDSTAGAIAREIIAYLGAEGFALIRDELLSDLGAIVKLRVALPDLPISAVEVGAAGEHITIAAQTDRPVRRGVQGAATGDNITLRMSGSAMAELANWAMDEGHLPRRYNQDMEADASGDLSLRIDWSAGGARPLRLHVFMEQPECIRVLVAATMSVGVERGDLKTIVSDGEIIDVAGSWRAKIGVWLDRLGDGPIAFVQQRAARVEIDIAGKRRVIELTGAALENDELILYARGQD